MFFGFDLLDVEQKKTYFLNRNHSLICVTYNCDYSLFLSDFD